MLLEFTEETDETQIHDPAIELRKRVAGRKLQHAADLGVVDADGILEMKEKNRSEQQQNNRLGVEVTYAEVKDRVALTRANQHLKAVGQVHMLGRDIARASRLGKARMDALSDLEKRIINMRSQLHTHHVRPVDDEVNAELNQNNKLAKLERKFEDCKFCQRRILLELLKTHENMCIKNPKHAKEEGDIVLPGHGISNNRVDVLSLIKVDTVEHNLVTQLATYKPRPVRNCRLLRKGISFIEWVWEPPVIAGGLEITNYEISFHAKYMEFDPVVGKFRKWEEDFPSVLTSTWVYRDQPVCNNGYKICGLRAGSEYSNFRIRCCNIRGWSEWVDMLMDNYEHAPSSSAKGSNSSKKFLDKVITDDAVPPTVPLFVNCEEITSSCIHISWSPPLFDGGLPIVDYIVHYTIVERTLTVTARDFVVERHKYFKTKDGHATTAVIRHLPDDTDIINIHVCAKHSGGLISGKGHLKQPVCRTKLSCRYTLLTREFEIASSCKDEFVDSGFFTGVKQRLNKTDHMRRLKEELEVTRPDPLELEEAKEWAAIMIREQAEQEAKDSTQVELASSAESIASKATATTTSEEDQEVMKLINGYDPTGFNFNYKQRKVHFEHKIKTLELTLKGLEQEKMTIDRRRVENTFSMRSKEKKLLAITLERERLKHYNGTVITSSVLTGADIQYKTPDFRVRIETAYELIIGEIANLKYEVITGENRRHSIKADIAKCEEERKTRLAKFLQFESKYQKTLRMIKNLQIKKGGSDTESWTTTGNRTHGSQDTELITEEERYFILHSFFKQFVAYMNDRKHSRYRIINMFENMMMRLKSQAFTRWKCGPMATESVQGGGGLGFQHSAQGMVVQRTVGDVMLDKAYTKRLELQEAFREMINSTAGINQKIVLSKLSQDARKKLTSLKDFKLMDEGMDHNQLYLRGMKLLYEGDGYVKDGKFALAASMYDAQIVWLRSKPVVDIKYLAICHGRLGQMYLQLHEYARAIVDFDRQLSLAREINDKVEESNAFFGLGHGYLTIYDYDNAIRYLTIAQAQFISLGRIVKYKESLYLIRQAYEKLNKVDKVAVYTHKIQEVDEGMTKKIRDMYSQLEDMKSRLVTTAAEIELVIPIERVTFKALEYRKAIQKGDDAMKELENDMKLQQENIDQVQFVLDAIQAEMIKASESDEPEMWSALVHDQPQIVEIEELKTRLKARSIMEIQRLQEEHQRKKVIEVKMRNIESEVLESEQLLQLEEGALMKRSHTGKPFRCVGLCTTNAAGNEVTGTATGGHEEFVAAEGFHIHMLDYHNGELKHVLVGGNEDTGHVGVITCLLHDGNVIFSGSADERIICWDTESSKLIRVLEGHEGSIVALASEANMLASSSADNTIRIWNKHNGKQLRVVFGHSKSALSLEIGPTWMLTGSADHEARLWKISPKNKHSINVECAARMIGHEAQVTCVRYGAIEVMTGDQHGRIFIWWLKTGEVIRRCQVHEGPVKCMQFDSVHIVSGGVDHNVCVTDIASGEVLQKLRGHSEAVLALAFDSERILTVGGDNSIRYWQWGKKSGPQDKYHVIEPNETLVMIAKKNNLAIDTLMKWNGITNAKQVQQGMKVIVKKGDPSVLTHAEKVAKEREEANKQSAEWAAKKLAKMSSSSSELGGIDSKLALPTNDPYRRVHHLVSDIDFFSLANRLFGQENRKLDLFPDTTFEKADKYSLAGRLNQDPNLDVGGSKVRPRVFLNADNEDDWGPVSDKLGEVMMDMMTEMLSYEIILEQKRELRSTKTVIGRIFTQQKKQQQALLLANAPANHSEQTASSTPLLTDGSAMEDNSPLILHRIDEEAMEDLNREEGDAKHQDLVEGKIDYELPLPAAESNKGIAEVEEVDPVEVQRREELEKRLAEQRRRDHLRKERKLKKKNEKKGKKASSTETDSDISDQETSAPSTNLPPIPSKSPSKKALAADNKPSSTDVKLPPIQN